MRRMNEFSNKAEEITIDDSYYDEEIDVYVVHFQEHPEWRNRMLKFNIGDITHMAAPLQFNVFDHQSASDYEPESGYAGMCIWYDNADNTMAQGAPHVYTTNNADYAYFDWDTASELSQIIIYYTDGLCIGTYYYEY